MLLGDHQGVLDGGSVSMLPRPAPGVCTRSAISAARPRSPTEVGRRVKCPRRTALEKSPMICSLSTWFQASQTIVASAAERSKGAIHQPVADFRQRHIASVGWPFRQTEAQPPDQSRQLSGPRRRGDVPAPAAAKLERLAEMGERRSFAPGEALYEQGQRDAPFLVIVRGRVQVIDRKPGKDVWIAEADAGTFLGDIATFTGEPAIAECVADEPTDVIAFERPELRAMLAAWPGHGRARPAHDDGPPRVARGERARRAAADRPARLAARLRGARPARAQPDAGALVRRRHRPRERGDARLAGYPARGDADPRAQHRGAAQPLGRSGGPRARPAGRDRRRALRPRRARRRARRALPPPSTAAPRGCGRSWPRRGRPAARPAPARGSRTTSASPPASPAPSSRARRRCRRTASTRCSRASTARSSWRAGPRDSCASTSTTASTRSRGPSSSHGARWRTLGADNVERFTGAGVYHAAMATDAERCRDEDVLVVGGGNSAGQAAMHLSRAARSVRMVVRGEGSRARCRATSSTASSRAPNIEVMTRHRGQRRPRQRPARTCRPAQPRERATSSGSRTSAVFVMIGADPCTEAVHMHARHRRGRLHHLRRRRGGMRGADRWPRGDRRPHLLETVWPGVFAAGDVRAGATKRVSGAVGDGALAGRFAQQVLEA